MSEQIDPSPKERRDRWLPKIRATRAELNIIEARRAASGLPLSEYVRRQAKEGHLIIRDPLADQQLLLSLIHI